MRLRTVVARFAWAGAGLALGLSVAALAAPGAISSLFQDVGGGVYKLKGGEIVNGSVTSAQIAPGTIVASNLADGNVTNQKIAANAVSDDKISGVAWGKISGFPGFPGESDATVSQNLYQENRCSATATAAGCVPCGCDAGNDYRLTYSSTSSNSCSCNAWCCAFGCGWVSIGGNCTSGNTYLGKVKP